MGVTLPLDKNIPRIRTYPNGGLGVLRNATVLPPMYDTEESSEDSDSDGANPPFLSTSPLPFDQGNFELERGQEMAYYRLIRMW